MIDQADTTAPRADGPRPMAEHALDLSQDGVTLHRRGPDGTWQGVEHVPLQLGRVGQNMARLLAHAGSDKAPLPVEIWLPAEQLVLPDVDANHDPLLTDKATGAAVPVALLDETAEFLGRHGFLPVCYTFRETPRGLEQIPSFRPPVEAAAPNPANRRGLALAATVALAALGVGGLWTLAERDRPDRPPLSLTSVQQVALSAEAAPALEHPVAAIPAPPRHIAPLGAETRFMLDAAPTALPRPAGVVAMAGQIEAPVQPSETVAPRIPTSDLAGIGPQAAPDGPASTTRDATAELASLGTLRLLADPPLTVTLQPELPTGIVDARATLPTTQVPTEAPRMPSAASLTETPAAEALPTIRDNLRAARSFRPDLLDHVAELSLPEIAVSRSAAPGTEAAPLRTQAPAPILLAELQTLPVVPPMRPGPPAPAVATPVAAAPAATSAESPAPEPSGAVQVFARLPDIVPPSRPAGQSAVAVIPEEPALVPPERPEDAGSPVQVFARAPEVVPPLRDGDAAAPAPETSAGRAVEAAEIATAVAAAAATATADAEELAASPNAIRRMARPPARPGAMTAEEREREELMAALEPSDLALTRSDAPRARPDAVVVRVPAPAAAAAGAMATTPTAPPAVAAVRQPVPGTTVAPKPQDVPRAATAPRPAPQLPTSASVAKAATVDNAMPMRQLALVGVFGKSGSRHALVRLPNGRFVKVGPGDSVDGYQVAAIGENAVRMRRGGRDTVLEIPR